MPTSPLSDNPLEILRLHLASGVKATPLCIAVIGWISNVPTDPYVASIKLKDDQIMLRLSNEKDMEPLCGVAEFLDQVCVICRSLRLEDGQTNYVVRRAQCLLD